MGIALRKDKPSDLNLLARDNWDIPSHPPNHDRWSKSLAPFQVSAPPGSHTSNNRRCAPNIPDDAPYHTQST
jgi:hypothetical protein